MPTNTASLRGDRNVLTDLIERKFVGDFYDDTITSIQWAFREQPYMTSISLPNCTSFQNDSAFENCTELVSASFPSLTSLRTQAFRGCSKLTTVNLPNVTGMAGQGAFWGCSSFAGDGLDLTKLTIVYANTFRETAIVNASLDSLTNFNGGSTSGVNWTFGNCASLRRIYAPKATVFAEDNCIRGASALEILRTPLFPTNKNTNFFTNYSTSVSTDKRPNMKLIDIGGCNSLSKTDFLETLVYTKILIIRYTSSVIALGSSGVFTDETTPTAIKVYVPSSLVESYKTATNWSTLYNKGKVVFYALEGSPYEDPEFDDTAIYNADRSTL